ncbi:DUF6801 domain-containing protein [Streptomyces sp. NPDC050738]|uniref:DUF6801 domain-containing protein n=1 Tax=Streptomyces sp. NPDC050738 TaxID=3154744 RepID=UPI003443A444
MKVKSAAIGNRRSARLASMAAVVILGGLLSGAGSAADEQKIAASPSYDCRLPSGSRQVTVGIAVSSPVSGTVGQPIQPGRVEVTTALAHADLQTLLPAGTSAVVSSATLDVRVAQNSDTATAQWTGLTAPNISVPAEGDLLLVHSGEVPTVTVGSPGDVTVTAGRLRLELQPAAPDEGGPAPAAVSVTCELGGGQKGLLATVPVSGGSGGDTPGASETRQPGEPGGERRDGLAVGPQAAPADPTFVCPPTPTGEPDVSDAPPWTPGPVEPVRRRIATATGVCAYAVGYATVTKLNGSMIINDPSKKPALISALANMYSVTRGAKDGYYQRFDSIASIDLPDAESTFLTFGFMPVTAKVAFETGPMSIFTGSIGSPPNKTDFAVISFMQTLRVFDVKVNGVPLDVGNSCRTEKPFKVRFDGDFRIYKNVVLGGPLTGKVNIPRFSGCGTSEEDLSPIFTAAISGNGNQIDMNQGVACQPQYSNPSKNNCPPVIPPLPGK